MLKYFKGLRTFRAGVILLGLMVQLCSTLFAQDQLLPVLHFQHLSTDDGLPTNEIRSPVVRDGKGFFWIGTFNGLERYDGYSFKDYRKIPDDPYSVSSNVVWSLLVDSKQRLWVGTFETGVSLYDPNRDRFINFLPRPGDSSWYQGKPVWTIIEDHSGNIWLGTEMEGVVRFEIPSDVGFSNPDSLLRGVRIRTYSLGTPRDCAYDLLEREDGKFLVASDGGLMILDPVTHASSRFRLADPLGRRLDSIAVRCIAKDTRGNLWLGTSTEGVFRLDFKNGKILNYKHKKGDGLSISSDQIWDIAEDQRGDLWLGTVEGIDLFSPESGHSMPYLAFARNPRSTTGRNLLSVDRTGTLWISTDNNGVYLLSPKSLRLSCYSSRGPDGLPRAYNTIERDQTGKLWLFSRGIVDQIDVDTRRALRSIDVFRGRKETYEEPDNSSSLIDRRGHFWYGTWGLGLYEVDLASGSVRNYSYESPFGKEIGLRSIAQGFGDSLWIASYYDGLMQFDPHSGRFLRGPILNVIRASNVIQDCDGRIWLATEQDGLIIYDPITGTSDHLVHNPSDPRSLSNGMTVKTYQDSSGRVWVCAGNVINLWDPTTRSFARYPNPAFGQAVHAIPVGSDIKGRLWLGYVYEGLSILDPATGIFTNLDESDGVCGRVFDMENLADGGVILTGSKGINIFYPDSIDLHRPPPPLVIARMAINDESVVPPSLLNGSGSIRLSHEQDVLEFEFAAIDIDAPHLVQYQYQLEGLEKDWVKSRDRRYVRYPSLSPRNYIFRVRAVSSRGEWPDQEIALAVSIAPPWWQTAWAYAAYLSLLVGLLYAGYRVRIRQVQLKQQAEMEHFQAEHLAEVDRLKSRFFANISHEFRTPLTLILGPLEKIRSKVADEEIQHAVRMMNRNAHRLLRLINQLLDLSKLEAGAMKLRASPMNIVPLVKGIAYSFESSAGLRKVDLNLVVDRDDIEVYCDKDMMEKILTNLLSNAFKFTPEGGAVAVTLTPRRVESSTVPSPIGRGVSEGRGEGLVSIAVSDTGIGIPPDQLDRVFDRFYQVDASQTREHEGSGIGLALVKELVELHHGTIQVQSEVGRGTTFTVRLPLGRSHLKDDEIVDVPVIAQPTLHEVYVADADKSIEDAKETTEPEKAKGEEPIILVVEDNADVRAYIKDYLVSTYQVTEACDGAEGIEKAREVIPDLIISDVMMPKKDGYEVCRILKLDEKTSHIPIILLTAKAASENKIEGLETGADDYLIKPFEPKELLARVKNLIDLRRKLRERFSTSVPLRPGEIAVTSTDDVFLQRAKAIVEKRMADESFGVEEFATEVCMSRSQLHRKLTALTSLPSSDFVRYLRLHRAMDLLKSGAGSVSEIAYQVGFTDPSHFSRIFHRQFGVTPSESLNACHAARGPKKPA